MQAPTATFRDVYFGDVAMILQASKTTRRGERVTVWTWAKASDVVGCITTGLRASASMAAAISAVQSDARFSNVVA